jgi:dTMP kinase
VALIETGKLIVIEGNDGSGKGTQAELLASRLLTDLGVEVVSYREPGGSPIGEELRKIFKDQSLPRSPETNVDLIFANRRENWYQGILPALELGKWVVNDRSDMSTYAYQGHGEGFDLDEIRRRMDNMPDGYRNPSLEIVLDVSVDVCRARNANDPTKIDYFEEKGDGFFESVGVGYREIADLKGAQIIEGERSIEEIHAEIWRLVSKL